MKPGNAIEVKNITKSFKVYKDKGHTLKEKALFSKRRAYEVRKVIDGISFEVKKGEAIGLIGHNGCGKSTTLKMLTRIMYPDSGTIEMDGRVSSLIELGAGFHPDMSGRDNIYINASIFGLTKKEIDDRVEDIIAFSELEEFIDNPVRTYSSGMYMRLAFAVAINVNAEILLIDEILGVGDVAFQAKCFNKLREIKADGTTIVIVSHSLSQIEQICDRSIWIHEGRIKEEGLPRIVDPIYMAYMSKKADENEKKYAEAQKEKIIEHKKEEISSKSEKKKVVEKIVEKKEERNVEEEENVESVSNEKESEENAKRWGSKEVVMEEVTIVDQDGKERYAFDNTEPFNVKIKYKAKKKIEDAVIGVAIYRDDQTYIYGTNTLIDYAEPMKLDEEGFIEMHVEKMPVNGGNYSIDLAFHRPDGFNYDFWREVCSVMIQNKRNEVGVISLPHEWKKL